MLGGHWSRQADRAIAGGVYIEMVDDDELIERCNDLTVREGWDFFGVQNKAQCFTAPDAGMTYNKHGPSSACESGMGGAWANSVYQTKCTNDVG